MKFLCSCVCVAAVLKLATPAPAGGFAFPSERRRDKKLEPIITPPVLPVLEHLERDPSTLLPGDSKPTGRHAVTGTRQRPLRPRFGVFNGPKFGGGFSLTPSNNGGLTASVSSSASGAGASQSASQSFSFGFNEGFSASHSASQSSSFSNHGFGNGFSGSQASSQAASFSGNSGSTAASSASSLASGGNSGSQSGSSAFGFNPLNGFQSTPPEDPVNFGEDILDVRHRGRHQAGAFVFPGTTGRGVGVASAKISRTRGRARSDDWLAILVSD